MSFAMTLRADLIKIDDSEPIDCIGNKSDRQKQRNDSSKNAANEQPCRKFIFLINIDQIMGILDPEIADPEAGDNRQ